MAQLTSLAGGVAAASARCTACTTPEKVDPNGGGIPLRRPLGASGVHVLRRLAYRLHGRGGGYGVAAACIGVGQGLALVVEA